MNAPTGLPVYRVDFKRIGRNHNVPSVQAAVSNADSLAAVIYGHARSYLMSSDFTVDVDLEAMKGLIDGGRFGTFTITELVAGAVSE